MSGFSSSYENIAKNRSLLDQIALPEYQEYVPQLENYESTQAQTLSEDPVLRSQQISILNKMAGLADTGMSDADAEGFNKARELGAQQAKAGRESALSGAQMRGVGGSGLEFALREAGNQSGAQASQNAGLNQAAESARGRAAYLKAFGDATGSMRNQDYRAQAENTGIINQFNRLNSQGRNNANQANNEARNTAFQYNQGLKDKNYNNQMQRATGQINLNNQESDIKLAQDEQRRKKNGAAYGAVGAGIGTMVGGPAGGQMGYALGSGLGGN